MKLNVIMEEDKIPDCLQFSLDIFIFEQIQKLAKNATSIDELIEALQKYFFKMRLKKVNTDVNWYTDDDSVIITHREKIICRCVQKM